jgi:hypothetical protein
VGHGSRFWLELRSVAETGQKGEGLKG